MASGTLGTSSPAANTWTAVYTCPVGKVATINIRFVNLDTTTNLLLRAAITPTTGAPSGNQFYIEPIDYNMAPGEVLEDIGLVIGAGDIVNVSSNLAMLAVRVHGFESNP